MRRLNLNRNGIIACLCILAAFLLLLNDNIGGLWFLSMAWIIPYMLPDEKEAPK